MRNPTALIRPISLLVVTYFTLLPATCCAQDDDADFEKKKQEFVIGQVRKTVESQFMAPVLIRANDLARFLDLPPDDQYRLIVASKGAASAIADDFRFPNAVITHRPWKEIDEFTLNGKTVEFPEGLAGDKKAAPVGPTVVKVTVGGTNTRIYIKYGRTGISTSVSGGLNAVFGHELFRRTLGDLVTDEQLKEYEKHRTGRMRNAIAGFICASLDVRLTLQEEQRKTIHQWLVTATSDVAANPDNDISQNANFLIKEIDDEPLKKILSEGQLELWQAVRPLLEEKQW